MPLPCYKPSPKSTPSTAMDRLMMLAEISAINSTKIGTSRAGSSRSSTPSFLSDNSGNQLKIDSAPRPQHVLDKSKITHKEAGPMITALPATEVLLPDPLAASEKKDITDDAPPTSFFSNKMSAKLKRPKRGKKALRELDHSAKVQSFGNEQEKPLLELKRVGSNELTEKEDFKSSNDLIEAAARKAYRQGQGKHVKTLFEEIRKLDVNRALFPMKLFELLSHKDTDPEIISWANNGKCFRIRDLDKFTEKILPHVFNQTSFASFQRQLNLYGFKRVTKPGTPVERAYFHEMFLRDQPELCLKIRRNKVKNAADKAAGLVSDSDSASVEQTEPDKPKEETLVEVVSRKRKASIGSDSRKGNKDAEESDDDSNSNEKKVSKTVASPKEERTLPAVDPYMQYLLALSQENSLFRPNDSALVPNLNDRISAINHLLNPSLANNISSAPGLLQLQQQRGQLLGNLNVGLQSLRPNTSGNILNPLNQANMNMLLRKNQDSFYR